MWDKAAEITGSWITKWESKSVSQLWGQQCSNSTSQSVAQPINPPASQPTSQLFNWPISYINIQQDEGHRKVARQLESADTTRRPMAIWKSGKQIGNTLKRWAQQHDLEASFSATKSHNFHHVIFCVIHVYQWGSKERRKADCLQGVRGEAVKSWWSGWGAPAYHEDTTGWL